jgi:hypothetical protein
MEILKAKDGIPSWEFGDVLSTIPGDLNASYDMMLEAIDSSRRLVVNIVLKWLLASFRPLYVEEAVELLKIKFQKGLPPLQDDNLGPLWLLRVLKDIIKVIPEVENWNKLSSQSHTVDWAHFTVKDYLTDTDHNSRILEAFRLDTASAHSCISKCSLAYLFCTNTPERKHINFPLRSYAWNNWRRHAEQSQDWRQETRVQLTKILQRKWEDPLEHVKEPFFRTLREHLEWMDASESARLLRAVTEPFFFEEYDPEPLYPELDDNTIRVLEIKPSSDSDEEIRCRFLPIHRMGSRGAIPDYRVFSGSWELSESSSSIVDFRINGRLMTQNIPKRLLEIFQSLRARYRGGYRDKYWSHWIFVDRICINQENSSEKVRAESALPQIFQQASEISVDLAHINNPNLTCELLQQMIGLKKRAGSLRAIREIYWNEFDLWNIITSFFDHMWWRRARVLQYASMCKSVQVLIERTSISVDDIGLLLQDDYLQRRLDELAFETNRPISAWKPAYGLTTVRSILAVRPMELPEVLFLTRFHKETSLHDSLFSKVGLASPTNGLQKWPIDYTLSPEEIFTEYSVRILQESKCLDLFSYIFTGENLDFNFSWVSTLYTTKDIPIPLVRGIFSGVIQQDVFSAAGKMLHIDGKVERDSLVIKGVCVDTVLSVGEIMNGRTWEEIPNQRDQLFAGLDDTVIDYESSAAIEALWRTALADQWSIGRRISQDADAAHSLPTSMSSERLWLTGPQLQERLGREPYMLRTLGPLQLGGKLPPKSRHYRTGRRLCYTKHGRFGLVPDTTHVGDAVVIFPGGRVPYILRAWPESVPEKCYKLLGEWFVHCRAFLSLTDCRYSYIHGLMDGEVVEQGFEDALEHFNLCPAQGPGRSRTTARWLYWTIILFFSFASFFLSSLFSPKSESSSLSSVSHPGFA